MRDESTKKRINRAYEFDEEQQKLLDEGKITEEKWYQINKQFFTKNYLASDNPRGQSGHSGDEFHYFHSHSMLLEAVNKNGSFIDVGCANGYLLESLDKWIKSLGYYHIDFYGLDISEELIELAKSRLPQWNDKLFTGNAFTWVPTMKFDFVCVKELNYVPRDKQRDFLKHLLDHYVVQGGRLIWKPDLENKLLSWGFEPTGYIEKSHHKYKDVPRKLLWWDMG